MNKLCNLVTILDNNENCVNLKVKPNKREELIRLGYFNGNEDIIRLTKGKNHTCTIIYKDLTTKSWDWGSSGYTLVSNETSKAGRLIEECITEDFDIYIGDKENNIRDSLNIKSLDDTKKRKHDIEVMYFKNDSDVSVHKDGTFYKHFKSVNDVKQHFKELEYNMNYKNQYIASTGCVVEEYRIIRKKELSYDNEDAKIETDNSIEVEINNGGKLRIKQTESDKARCGVALESIDSNGEVARRDLIDEGDFVMLMNYYRYIKDNDIKDDFINRNGINEKDDYSLDEEMEI